MCSSLIINDRIKDTWSTPKQRLDGKWCFPKPDEYLFDIENFVVEEYTHFWFITEEDFLATFLN